MLNLFRVSGLDTTLQKTENWLNELGEVGDFANREDAFTALRAVLQTLRDVLTVGDSAQLASKLPMLVRGLYFEGWEPSKVPCPARDREVFLNRVWARMTNEWLEPEDACRAVFAVLQKRVDAEEIADVRRAMHGSLRDLWDLSAWHVRAN